MQQMGIKQSELDMRDFPDLSVSETGLLTRIQAMNLLYSKQKEELEKKNLMKPLLEIEMPISYVLSDMECIGVCLDTQAYAKHKAPLQRRQEEVNCEAIRRLWNIQYKCPNVQYTTLNMIKASDVMHMQ